MFRLNKPRSQKSGERLDFSFSNLQALQVPKGWDKLSLIIVSVESGKRNAKTGKASVLNGKCQWTETLSESILIPQDDVSNGIEEYLYKFVVMMGSARSGILGEAKLNLASYMSSKRPVPVSVPLEKCSHGTTLQVRVQCLTPRAKHRVKKLKDINSHLEDENNDYDVESKSDVSDKSLAISVGSSPRNHSDGTIHPGELCSRDPSFSESGSHHSFDSVEDSFNKEKFSNQTTSNGVVDNQIRREDSIGSQTGSPFGSNSFSDSFRSNHSSLSSRVSSPASHAQNDREESNHISHTVPISPLRYSRSSKDLEAAQVTIVELRAEAKMWEQNARKLAADVETLQKEVSNHSRRQESLEMELSAAQAECDGLKKEMEHQKTLFDESMAKKGSTHKDLEEEMKYENANLALQLQKTQESNIELVSILQELEETIEKQKLEICDLSKSEPGRDVETSGLGLEGNISKQVLHVDIEEEENSNLGVQLKQSQERQNNMETTTQSLELTLEDKSREIEIERGLKSEALFNVEAEWSRRLAEREEKIVILEAKLSAAHGNKVLLEKGFGNEDDNNLATEIKSLKQKVQELEKDCTELTDENLELIFKLKEANRVLPTSGASPSIPSDECGDNGIVCTSEFEVSRLKAQIHELSEELLKKTTLAGFSADPLQVQYSNLENNNKGAELSELLSNLYEEVELSLASTKKQFNTPNLPTESRSSLGSNNSDMIGSTDLVTLKEKAAAIFKKFIQLKELLAENQTVCEGVISGKEIMPSMVKYAEVQSEMEVHTQISPEMVSSKEISENLQYKEEVDALRNCQKELEGQISNMQIEKSNLEEKIKDMLTKGEITTKCVEDLRNEIAVLNKNTDSLVLENRTLVRQSSELKSGKQEMEVHLSQLEEENVQLSERRCGLEAQLRYLTDERGSSRLELQNSELRIVNLQDEIRRLESEMQEQKYDMKKKLQDMQSMWLEAQNECEYLKKVNPQLQGTTESLIEECSLLQESNRELRKQRIELHEQCTVLEAEQMESEKIFFNILEKVEALEEKLSSMLEEVASKQTAVNLELDALIHENKNYKERLVSEENLLNQMYLEKTVEVENLQREVAHLTEQISSTQDEKERSGSEAVLEVSHLRAGKATLEASLMETQEKLNVSERNLTSLKIESETKVQASVSELVDSKHNLEVLMADHEKILTLLEEVKCNEEKLKSTVRGLELKLKSSEYERLHVEKDISNLNVQLQKAAPLQEEISSLKISLHEAKLESERADVSFQMLSRDHEELQAERTLFVQKLSTCQRTISELEDCKHRKVALEEKVLRLEGDLAAKEEFSAQEATLKNELAQVRSENRTLSKKIKYLEGEKEDCMKRYQALEEDMKQFKGVKQGSPATDNWELSPEGDSVQTSKTGSSQSKEADLLSKIQGLENELAEALEANDMYKAHLKSLLSQEPSSQSDAPKKSRPDHETLKNDGSALKLSFVEAELKDMQERYFLMSLKYAEAEAERDKLLIKLRGSNNRRSWFPL